jgi:hypothetical protein
VRRVLRFVTASRKRLVLAGAPVSLLLVAAVAIAYFTTAGSGNATAIVGVLGAPAAPSATPGTGTVALSWSSVSPPVGSDTVAYYVTRDGSAPGGNCPTSSSPSTVTSCTDSGLAAGTYQYTVTAVWRSWIATSGSTAATVTGALDHFTVSAATTTPSPGAADTLTITAKDSGGNTVTAYTGDQTLTFGGASTIGSFQPAVTSKTGTAVAFGTAETLTFTAGVATVSGSNNGAMTLYKAESATVTVSDGTHTGSVSVSVSPASAASFAVSAPGSATAGSALSASLTAKDAYGNTATGYTGSHTIDFSGPHASPGGTSPSYPASVTFTSGAGSASVTLYDAETATLTAADHAGPAITGTSGSIAVGPGSSASLSLSAASTTPAAGATDNLTVTAQDTWLNTATGYAGDKSLTFGGAANAPDGTRPAVTNKSGVAVNFGTATTITFVNGAAVVSGSANGVMTLYKAESPSVTVTDGTISNGSGLAVTVGPGSAASLSLSAASTTPTAGAADNLTITTKDTWLNTATGYTGSKNLSFSGSSAMGGNNPTVTNGSGTAVAFGSTTAITFSSGVATVSGSSNGVMKLYAAGSPSIVVSDGTISNGAGLSLTVGAASSTKLGFTQQPSASTGGIAFATQPKVAVQDTYGNTITADSSSVTLAITGGTGTAGATLACTANPLAASGGVATFAACAIDKSGTGYTLTATDGSLTSATSSALNVTVGPAAKLAFTQQPASGSAGIAFTTQPKVAVVDAGGNTVTTDSSSVTLAITSGTGTSGAALTCTTNPVSASSGVATFAGCKIDIGGAGYQLHATDGSLTAVDSSAFGVLGLQALGTPSTVASGASGSFTTSNTYTSRAGAIVLVIVSTHQSTKTPTLSVSGGPTTGSFTAVPSSVVTTKSGPGDASSVEAFWAVGTSTTAAFTITGAATISDAVVEVVQILGANTSAPIVGTPVTATGNSASASATFSAPASGDAQIVVVAALKGGVGGGATSVTAPTGFTELQDTAGGSGGTTQTLESSYTLSPVTGAVTATIANSSNWGAIGIEIAHS